MKIKIYNDDGKMLDTLNIPLVFEADDEPAAIDIRNMIGEQWNIQDEEPEQPVAVNLSPNLAEILAKAKITYGGMNEDDAKEVMALKRYLRLAVASRKSREG
jgi:hypothetical protein